MKIPLFKILNLHKNKMKKITFEQVTKIADFKNCIFIRRNFSGDWSVYFDLINEPFYNLQDAIKYFREHNKERQYFELCEYDQVECNGSWDNC